MRTHRMGISGIAHAVGSMTPGGGMWSPVGAAAMMGRHPMVWASAMTGSVHVMRRHWSAVWTKASHVTFLVRITRGWGHAWVGSAMGRKLTSVTLNVLPRSVGDW